MEVIRSSEFALAHHGNVGWSIPSENATYSGPEGSIGLVVKEGS